MSSLASLSLRKRYFFYTQMAQMLDAGITPVQGLKMIAEQKKAGSVGKIANSMKEHIEQGGSFASAMANLPSRFPSMEVQLIETAESAGFIPTTLTRLAEFNRQVRSYRAEFLNRLIYPLLLIFTALFFIPVFVSIFVGDVVQALIACGYRFLYLLAWGVAIWMLWRILINISFTRFILHRLFLSIPTAGRYIHKLILARFARTLEFLYSAGIPVSDALYLAARSCGNEALARVLQPTSESVKEGRTVTESLSETCEFTPLALGIIESGEISGKLDASLRKFSEYMELEAWSGIQQLTRLIPILIYLMVMGAIVGLVFVAFRNYLAGIQSLL